MYNAARGKCVDAAVSVGVASTAVLRPNQFRKRLSLVNTSANWISVFFGEGAGALYAGKTLSPNGGAMVVEPVLVQGDNGVAPYIWVGAVYAIASGAASNLSVSEEE